MPGGDGVAGTVFVGGARVPAEVGHPGGQPVNQPRRWLGGADIDGEVQHAGHRGLVAVVARGRTGLTCHSTTVVPRQTGHPDDRRRRGEQFVDPQVIACDAAGLFD